MHLGYSMVTGNAAHAEVSRGGTSIFMTKTNIDAWKVHKIRCLLRKYTLAVITGRNNFYTRHQVKETCAVLILLIVNCKWRGRGL